MTSRHVAQALVLPGYGGSRTSPLVVSLVEALSEAAIRAQGISLARKAPKPGLAAEVEQLRKVMTSFFSREAMPRFLVGRSFGGRVGVFLAAQEPVTALVLLGYPIRPPGKLRKLDEEAFLRLQCPTLVIQGDSDELGPMGVVKRLAKKNPQVELKVLEGTGHALGRKEGLAIQWAVDFLLSHCESRQG